MAPERPIAAIHKPELTIDRLFDAPALAGPTVAGLTISPDGKRITFLKGKDTDKDCLDLWEFDTETSVQRRLVDASLLPSSAKDLSEEETGRRERQRTAALRGIVEYQFFPAGDALLFPVSGDLLHCHIADPAHVAVEAIPVMGPVTDSSVSPSGTMLAYIRAHDLYAYDIEKRSELRLTSDGGGVIKNGMAEFIAQEEMDRSTGYWWSPDARRIAFTRVDESPVPEMLRFEIAAGNVATYPQRYPQAGQDNVRVAIGVVDIGNSRTVWMDLGADQDIYVARVNWLPDGRTVAIQRQSRDQKHLDLMFADASTGTSRLVLSETSESWIDLHHELTFLKNEQEFIWASSRSGFLHLYLYRMDGTLVRQLTHGNWNVDNFRARAIRGVDETARVAYVMTTAASALERHLYAVHLDSAALSQITNEPGIHSVSMSPSADYFVDLFNSATQPPQLGVYHGDGRFKFWLLENRLDAEHAAAPYMSSHAQCEFGQLCAEDGQTLFYRIFKPQDFDDGKRYPAIVDVYGGPSVQRVQNNWAGSSFTQILVRAGFVVLMLDNRGSAHRGVAFQAPIEGRLGEAEAADQLVGARWLGAQAYIDSQRIGIWGWSYGGYLSLMLMFKAPAVFKAGVSGAPVTDWRLYDTHYTERYLGKPTDNHDGYEASSVIPLVGRCQGALLIIHGMADDNVLLLHSTKLFRHLQDKGKPFHVMIYPGAKHGLLRQHDGRHAYATILDFFRRHL